MSAGLLFGVHRPMVWIPRAHISQALQQSCVRKDHDFPRTPKCTTYNTSLVNDLDRVWWGLGTWECISCSLGNPGDNAKKRSPSFSLQVRAGLQTYLISQCSICKSPFDPLFRSHSTSVSQLVVSSFYIAWVCWVWSTSQTTHWQLPKPQLFWTLRYQMANLASKAEREIR